MPNLHFAQTTRTKGVDVTRQLQGAAVTPSDTVDLPDGPCQAIYVTASGNVNINLAGGGTAVLTSLTGGQIVRVNASRILATSTTATGIFALYEAANP